MIAVFNFYLNLSTQDILMTKQAETDSWDFKHEDINNPVLNDNGTKGWLRPSTAEQKSKPWLRPGMTFGMPGEGQKSRADPGMRNLMAHSDQHEWILTQKMKARAQASELTVEDI
jgi:hypothetical protein